MFFGVSVFVVFFGFWISLSSTVSITIPLPFLVGGFISFIGDNRIKTENQEGGEKVFWLSIFWIVD